MTYYVYTHSRILPNGSTEIFYVGKGSGWRAWNTAARSQTWKNYAGFSDIEIDIIEEFESEADAYAFEFYLTSSWKAIGADLAGLGDGGTRGAYGYTFAEKRHHSAPQKCTVDGIRIFRSKDEMKRELGKGKRGWRHPDFRVVE